MIYTEKKDVMSGFPYKFRCRAYGKYDKEFSGVSPTGLDKEYSDLDDYDGFSYTVSRIADVNATRIGNLTLSDYNISGFSTSNYLSKSISELGSVWEIRAKFKAASSTITGGQKILSIGTQNSERKYALIFFNNAGTGMYIRTSSNGVDAILTGSTQPTVSNNTTYYIKIGSDGTKSYAYYSTTGFDNMTLIEEVNTPTTIPADTLYLGYEPYYTAKGAFGGTIDLKECSIKKASQYFPDTWTTVWQGTTYQCTAIDFSDTTLPWKWDYKGKLKTSLYAADSQNATVTYYSNILNGTANGTVVIDSDRIMSGFSSSNYLTIGNINFATAKSWEYVSKFKATTIDKYQFFFHRPVAFGLDNSNRMHVWNLPVDNVYSSFTFSANTWYWVKFEFTGTEYNGYYKTTEDGEWTRIINVSSTSRITSTTTPTYIGLNPNNTSEYFYGYIDLSEAYISINGSKVWQAFDKHTVSGCINGSSDTGGNYYCYAINGDDHIELVKKTGSVIDARPTSPRYLGEAHAN